jgi:hypothetical protein
MKSKVDHITKGLYTEKYIRAAQWNGVEEIWMKALKQLQNVEM